MHKNNTKHWSTVFVILLWRMAHNMTWYAALNNDFMNKTQIYDYRKLAVTTA